MFKFVSPQLERIEKARLASRMALPYTPARLFWIVALSVFSAEALIMILLMVMPKMHPLQEVIFDSLLLVCLISPVLFLFLYRPVRRQMTAQAIADEKLRRNKDMLQTVFDGISDPLMLLDDQLRIKMLNLAALKYYDAELSELVDQPCHDALSSNSDHCDVCQISEAITGNKTITFERNGFTDPRRIEQVVIYRSKTEAGEPGAVIVHIIDVTEAKKLERQMIQQEKMASLGLLISSVVHEVNNPNNMISYNLPILKDYLESVMPIVAASDEKESAVEHLNITFDEFEKDIFELIENLDHGSNRINSIVSQLKTFARINKSKENSYVDLNHVVKNVVSICNGQIKRFASNFKVTIPDNLLPVYTNAEYLEQVLVNLLINACQAADKKEDAWISLNATSGARWDEHVIIEVSDNGSGMDEQTMKRVFDPLFTTKSTGNGTGLGLYVCKNLIESMGGRLEVESTIGVGTTFRVCLPDEERREGNRQVV